MKKVPLFLCAALLFIFTAEGQSGISPDVERAFAQAGLRVLRQRAAPPDFSLPYLSGGTAALSSLKGKVVLLNFWATWCPPCRAEMPSMEALYRRFKQAGLEILAVNCAEKTPDVQRFISGNRYSFPVMLDSSGEISGRYGITGIPTTYILDREGKILLRVVGSLRWDDPGIIAAIEALLKSR
jgi:thiol-disulfide isomerase/thioredoxin